MIKILYILTILCASLAINITPYKSPSPVQSLNKTIKNILTSTATVRNIIKNMTVEQKKNDSVLQNKTNVRLSSNSTLEKIKISTILKLSVIGFVLFISISLYFKLKNILKPIPKQYLPHTAIDKKPIIDFNPYNRDNEKCYKRLPGSNSPV